MQSHIGCICLIFLHCVFSNVSSNCPLERMHSRIGCMRTDVNPQVTYISTFLATLVAALKKKLPMSMVTGISKPMDSPGKFWFWTRRFWIWNPKILVWGGTIKERCQADNLRRHLKTHSGEKSKKCIQCDFASSPTCKLKTHSTTQLRKVQLVW